MYKTILIFMTMFITVAFAQKSIVRGKITYISGESVYTSLGRESGVKDSSILYVFSNLDTISTLKVFATSSKSSVCKIVKTKRQLHIGDFITAVVGLAAKSIQALTQQLPTSDTIRATPQTTLVVVQNIVAQRNSQPLVSVQGSVSLQYFTTRQSVSNTNISQPGMVLNLRGRINDLPIKFQLYGNFRSLMYGNTKTINQTRFYQISIDYDDDINQISVGRIIPFHAPSIGYIDGIIVARRFGSFILGSAGGFDPNYNQQGLSTDIKKFSFFGSYKSVGSTTYFANLAYSRTFFLSQIDREVINSSITITPSDAIFFTAQSDVDLRTKKDQTLILKPQLTNLAASLNYRPFNFLTLGFGMTAWRSSYRFSIVKTIPDSVLDRKLRLNPMVSLNVLLPGGVSFSDTYTPRFSDNSFGKEYSNHTAFGISNLFGQGILFRGTMTVNSTTLSITRGYEISIQKSFAELGDVNLRYQFYRSIISQYDDTNTNKIIGLDLMVFAFNNLTFWGSLERLIGFDANTTTISAEISWRF